MAAIVTVDIPVDIQRDFASLLGQTCCLQDVDNDRGLSLGFGEILFVKNPKGSKPHGKWEIGTYRSAWRIIENHRIVCGSKEAVDSLDEFREILKKLAGSRCISIQMITGFDVRVVLDRGICVDFFGTFGDDDEVFHVFLPNGRVVALSIDGQWDSQDGVLCSD